MARRSRRAPDPQPKRRAEEPGPLNAPFRGLGKQLAGGRATPKPTAPPPAPEPPRPDAPVVDDATLFTQAMAGVAPAPGGVARIAAALRPVERVTTSDDDEALAELADLVAGNAEFDISDTREYVEGAVVGLDPRIVRRLRRGEYSTQAHLDLHRMTQVVARDAVAGFLAASVTKGLRCVLIVHGRGLNSKDQVPVLKARLQQWLARGQIGRVVLAFASARPQDGGAGALYVLLRRDRQRRPIEVTEGAKR